MRRGFTALAVCAVIAGWTAPSMAAVLVAPPPRLLQAAGAEPPRRPGVLLVFNKQNPRWSTEGRVPTHPFHKPYKPLREPPGALPQHPGGPRHPSQFINQRVLVTVATCFILAVGVYWLTTVLRLPSALVLVLLGVLVGPATHLLDPDVLFGNLLLPLVSLSLAILLFQHGMALRITAWRELGSLMTGGLLATWLMGVVAASVLLRLDPAMAVLLGLVLVLTASPAIVPMLRGSVDKRALTLRQAQGERENTYDDKPSTAQAELVEAGFASLSTLPGGGDGDGSDPAAAGSAAPALELVGALLFSLVFSAVLTGGARGSGMPALVGILKAVLAGIVAGGLGARAVALLSQDGRLVPPMFASAASLVVLVSVFTGANLVQEESGLIAAMVMGIACAAQGSVDVERLRRSQWSLDTLLGPVLLLLLTARLRFAGLERFAVPVLGFVVVAMLVVRPVAVALATWRFSMSRRERLFLACAAPRGVVPAALVSVLGMRLMEVGYKDARLLVPLTLLLIATTAAAAALGGWLGAEQAAPTPSGTGQLEPAPWPQELTASELRSSDQNH